MLKWKIYVDEMVINRFYIYVTIDFLFRIGGFLTYMSDVRGIITIRIAFIKFLTSFNVTFITSTIKMYIVDHMTLVSLKHKISFKFVRNYSKYNIKQA
jgi:hypothetical protein